MRQGRSTQPSQLPDQLPVARRPTATLCVQWDTGRRNTHSLRHRAQRTRAGAGPDARADLSPPGNEVPRVALRSAREGLQSTAVFFLFLTFFLPVPTAS